MRTILLSGVLGERESQYLDECVVMRYSLTAKTNVAEPEIAAMTANLVLSTSGRFVAVVPKFVAVLPQLAEITLILSRFWA